MSSLSNTQIAELHAYKEASRSYVVRTTEWITLYNRLCKEKKEELDAADSRVVTLPPKSYNKKEVIALLYNVVYDVYKNGLTTPGQVTVDNFIAKNL